MDGKATWKSMEMIEPRPANQPRPLTRERPARTRKSEIIWKKSRMMSILFMRFTLLPISSHVRATAAQHSVQDGASFATSTIASPALTAASPA